MWAFTRGVLAHGVPDIIYSLAQCLLEVTLWPPHGPGIGDLENQMQSAMGSLGPWVK